MGVTTRAAETLLSERAHDLLAAGPSDPVRLIEHICQMPGAPRVVAEQMALALFATRPEFARDGEGRWWLAEQLGDAGRGGAGREPAADSASPRVPASPNPELLSGLSYVVVDVETTGSRAEYGDRITEIAAIRVRDGRVVDTFETLVNPERPIPPMITALTNITWSMVKDAPRFRDISDRLLEVLEGHVFVAHNADFDWRFVSAEVRRATGRTLVGRKLCTVRLARRILPQLRSRRLDSVANHYGIEIAARHRAAGDALATAHVLLRLLAEARDRDCHRWQDLERLLGARSARKRRRPPASPHPVDRDTTA